MRHSIPFLKWINDKKNKVSLSSHLPLEQRITSHIKSGQELLANRTDILDLKKNSTPVPTT